MADFSCSWRVQYLGSYALEKTAPDDVSSFLANLQHTKSKSVDLAVSILGIRVRKGDKVVAAHSMRRVSSVIGRPARHQIAYISVDYVNCSKNSQKTCHVFAARSSEEVSDIEDVMDNAFQAALLTHKSAKPAQLTSKQETMTKRKRGFGTAINNAMYRLSSAQSKIKRVSTAPTPVIPAICAPSTSVEEKPKENQDPVFDERLEEWILPIDESTKKQLATCSFFIETPIREALIKNLLSRPYGAFVVRCSESKKNCLALSMRVPSSHNKSGISHYLIIRNTVGYRLKSHQKHFDSLQMLLTHYSVLQDELPCRMLFTNWNAVEWLKPPAKCRTAEKNVVRFQRYNNVF